MEGIESKKEEIFENLQKKAGLTAQQVTAEFERLKKVWKARSSAYTDEDAESRALGALQSRFKAYLAAGGTVSAVLVGANLTDFGVSRTYDSISKKWEDALKSGSDADRKKMVMEGLCDESGKPKYQSGFKKGQLIEDRNSNFEMQYYGKLKRDTDKAMQDGIILVKNYEGVKLPLFKRIKVNAKARRGQQTSILKLEVSNDPKLVNLEVLDEKPINFIDFTNKYLADRKKMIAELPEYSAVNTGNRDAYAVVEANIIDIYVNAGFSDQALLDDQSWGSDKAGITGWLPHHLPRDFTAGTEGVYVVGFPGIDKTNGNPTLNIIGVWTPEDVRAPAKEEIRADKIKEAEEPAGDEMF